MKQKPTWPPHLQPQPTNLSLPPRPGISRPIFADTCPRCRCLHMDQEEATRCRQASSQREQV